MNVKYTKVPREAEDHYQPVRRSSDSNITVEAESCVAGGLTRMSSLPTEYSKLHGFLRRLSNRRRATSERTGRSTREHDADTRQDSETEAIELVDDDHNSTNQEREGSYKYSKLNHTKLYRTQSDNVFNNNNNKNHPVVVK